MLEPIEMHQLIGKLNMGNSLVKCVQAVWESAKLARLSVQSGPVIIVKSA